MNNNNNNTTTTQKQALFALKRRAMCSTKIESGRTLLLHLQQQQHSLETSVHDHMLINTMEQTTQTLRNIRQGILFLATDTWMDTVTLCRQENVS